MTSLHDATLDELAAENKRLMKVEADCKKQRELIAEIVRQKRKIEEGERREMLKRISKTPTKDLAQIMEANRGIAGDR